MGYIYIITAFVVAMLLSYLILPSIILISYKKNLFDKIDERKVHTKQISRLGGVSFPLIIILTLLLINGISCLCGNSIGQLTSLPVILEFVFLISGMMLLFMIGVADDLIEVSYRSKLVAQLVAACFLPLSGLYISNLGGLFNVYEIPAYIGMPVTVFLVVYITNAINMIDGIDGLAAGISGIALIVVGLFFLLQEIWLYAMLAFIILGLLVPFFYYNVFKRKLFMGDTGSLTLGYIISFLIIHFCTNIPEMNITVDKNVVVIIFSVMIVPCFDVARVILVRLHNGKSPFHPDKNHIHHKFLLMRCTPCKSMILILSISLFFVGSNLLLNYYINPHIIIIYDVICWLVIHLLLNVCIDQYSDEAKVLERENVII